MTNTTKNTMENTKKNPFKTVAEAITKIGTIDIAKQWDERWAMTFAHPVSAYGKRYSLTNEVLIGAQYDFDPSKIRSVFATPAKLIETGINFKGGKTIRVLGKHLRTNIANEEQVERLENGEKIWGYEWNNEEKRWESKSWHNKMTCLFRVSDFGEEAESKFDYPFEKPTFTQKSAPAIFDEKFDNLANALGIKIIRDKESDRAFYSITHKEIHIPLYGQFFDKAKNDEKATQLYFATCFHEIAHAIRHKFVGDKTWNYAREEVIAENCAFWLACQNGYYTDYLAKQVANYTRGWFGKSNLQLNAQELEEFIKVSEDCEKVINYFSKYQFAQE